MICTTDGKLTIGGLDAQSLAKQFGTPLFVYDADEVRAGWRRIRRAFTYEPTHVHFAAVCNPNLYLLALLHAEGARLHANTPGDVYCGFRAGYEPHEIVFSGTNLTDDDLAYLLRARVYLNLDSLDDLRRACAMSTNREYGLRVHLEDALPESRVGLREDEVGEAVCIACSSDVRITALHVYCGTHGRSPDRYRAVLDRMAVLARDIPDLDCINLGGGFGYDYRAPNDHEFPFEALAQMAEERLRRLSSQLGRTVTLRIEPGRALVAGAAVLLTRVSSVKRTPAHRYVGVDTTTANFTSPVVHGSHRRIVCVEKRPLADTLADICGCTTYSRDFVARGVTVPDVRVDDLLAVLDVGAYGYCMASHFLNRPRPAEVFVERGKERLVTRRETFADLVAAQVAQVEVGTCAND